jgi:hypothetical protein
MTTTRTVTTTTTDTLTNPLTVSGSSEFVYSNLPNPLLDDNNEGGGAGAPPRFTNNLF